MTRVCVGIHVHAEPERLAATLSSVRARTPADVELLLLPDGPDAATAAFLATVPGLPRSGTDAALGQAACFNRLAARPADVLVLLESGAEVGPGWLDRLLAALDADPRNGLCGPSTNRSWNEQGAFPDAAGAEAGAVEAARRFGGAWRPLGPLHSLADFCYAVRREAVEAVGAADEGYGLGPCWEMDYSARAARAGFQGVWACAAYVHRAPFTARRRWEEELRFEASKRRYQDKFCGRRLRGERADYRPHCRGDSCPDFAPAGLIQLRIELADAGRVVPGPAVAAAPAEPLVSCIMPTCDRRGFVPLAVRWFLRQDYPNLELIVADDGRDPIADCLPRDPRVRYVRLADRRTVGAKRNLCCAHARGDVIVHWDDDDWYPLWRVGRQVRALRTHGADVCGSSQVYYFEPATGRRWRYHYAGPSPWVAGNTLAYRKSYWERHPFLDVQEGEDTRFVWSGPKHGVHDLADPGLCVATVHPRNTSHKVTEGCYWHPIPGGRLGDLSGADADAFRAAFLESPPAATPWPLVSCITPTYDRRAFLPLALEGFARQDYPNKELILVDDGTDPVGDLAEGAAGVRYVRLSGRHSIGAKRNLACKHAAGEIIAHWDDDDWYAPGRLRHQAAGIQRGECDLTGLENAFVLELPGGRCWTTRRELHRRMFVGDVHGGTLVYRRAIWEEGVRYPDVNLAEDAAFLAHAQQRGRRLLRLENAGMFIYVRHGRNAWQFRAGEFLDPAGWHLTEPPGTFTPRELAAFRAAAR